MSIPPIDEEARRLARERQDRLTKPAGSLGRLETLSVDLAGMTGRVDPPLGQRVVFTLAADHGVAAEGVSAYPREVTAQMVLNFLAGGAAVNVLARLVGARVVVADLGVDADLPNHPSLRALKVRRGTDSIMRGPAMSVDEARQAIDHGRQLVLDEMEHGLDDALTGVWDIPVEGVGHPGKRLAGFLRELVERRGWIAKPQRLGSAGVEVVAARRVLGHLAVFLPDLAAKVVDVDQFAHIEQEAAIATQCDDWTLRCRYFCTQC